MLERTPLREKDKHTEPIVQFSLFTASGHTRTHFERDHALIAPDGHVPSPLPAWGGAMGVVLISPAMGARLAQSLVTLEVGVASLRAAVGVESFFWVIEGELECQGQTLGAESYGFWPADAGALALDARAPTRLVVFEKRYEPMEGVDAPPAIFGHSGAVAGQPFLGDEDARLQVILPATRDFDMAVNLFTYQPGATLPFVETHVMEHGLLMLDGMGIYRLGGQWYPVAAGDTIWMAPYCPQWFAATGKTSARYIYFKNINRDAMETL